MADAFVNKIKRLELENFTCFDKVEMDFSPGINVFIGENGTGKTHLLKAMYALKQGEIRYPSIDVSDENPLIDNLEHSFDDVFRVSDLNQLINAAAKQNGFRVAIDKPTNGLMLGLKSYKEYLFIPAFEHLSWFGGFISAYENRESSIDETYYQLAKALDLLPLKGEKGVQQKLLVHEIENTIYVKAVRKGNDFFLVSQDGTKEFPASISASGINKLAQVAYLILNGSLTKDTILFWDEPEAGLNPKYIKPVAQFLLTLANAGCQIFVATHDYLLPYELSLSVEYADAMKKEKQKVPPMKFFTLMKGENGTVVESGDTMYDLPYDAIMEGHLQFHEKREQLQRDSLNQWT